MKAISLLTAAAVLTGATACLPPAQQTSGTAAYGSPNRYGYQGSQTSPSGQIGRPSAAPDGAIAQALAPQPNAGSINQLTTQGTPAGTVGSVATTPILPSVGTSATRPADTGINPSLATVPPAPPTAPTVTDTPKPKPPQTGTTSKPVDPPVASKPKDDYPYGIPVPGKDGMVYSPYDKDAGYVDVRNMKPGALVEDPYTKKLFRVP